MLIVKTAYAAIFEVSFGKMRKRCVEDSGLTTPPKIKAIQHYRPEYHERWSCLLHSRKGDSFVHIDFTCTHGGGNDCKRHVKSILLLLLSLNAHNHVGDYSGTLGGVRKVHISALVTSPKN